MKITQSQLKTLIKERVSKLIEHDLKEIYAGSQLELKAKNNLYNSVVSAIHSGLTPESINRIVKGALDNIDKPAPVTEHYNSGTNI